MRDWKHDWVRGQVIAQAMWSEFEKIANASVPGGAEMGDPQMGNLGGGVQTEAPADAGAEVLQNEAMPAHGVVASRVQQLDPRRAVGVPVMQPPPGYVYSPELASFVPHEGDPGWMAQQDVVEAARNQGWYQAGQQQLVQQQAQEHLDGQVQADLDAHTAQQQQAQMQQEQEAMAQQEATMTAARTQGKLQGQQAAGVQPEGQGSQQGGGGESSSSQGASQPKAKKKEEGGKGISIKIGQ